MTANRIGRFIRKAEQVLLVVGYVLIGTGIFYGMMFVL